MSTSTGHPPAGVSRRKKSRPRPNITLHIPTSMQGECVAKWIWNGFFIYFNFHLQEQMCVIINFCKHWHESHWIFAMNQHCMELNTSHKIFKSSVLATVGKESLFISNRLQFIVN